MRPIRLSTILCKIAAPEVQRPLEVVLSRVMVVNRQVCHRKSVRDPGQSLNDSPNSVPPKLLAKLVDQLGRSGPIDLGEGEIELPAHRRQVVVRRVGLIGD